MIHRGGRRRAPATVITASGVIALAVGMVLTGCSSPAPRPSARATTSSHTPAPVPSVLPTLDRAGSAKKNLAYFNFINDRTLAGNGNPTAQQFVDGLAAAGFSKADMQMTADKTTVNLTPGSVQFSVLINGGCLIGQFGSDIGGYHSTVAPVLSTGKCLIGQTVPIQ